LAPTKTENPSEYPGKELEAMSFAVNYHRWIVDELALYLGKTVVEVGAGRGDLSSMLLEKGLERLYAFEPSSNLYPVLEALAKSEPRLQSFQDFFNAESVSGNVDSVVYINVLEHIEDDLAELGMARQALKAGGRLLVFVPALSWLFSEADRSMGHFRRYSKKELVARVQEAGFEVENARYFDVAGVLPWYVNFVLLKNAFSSGSVSLYDRLVVPPMRRVERLLKPPVGKNVLLVARKAGS